MSRDRIISMRVSDDEHQALTEVAEAIGIPLSELVRRSALAVTYPPPPACVGGTSAAPLTRVILGGPA